jgi:hypothetical protein
MVVYYRYSQERKELIVMKRQPKKVYIEGASSWSPTATAKTAGDGRFREQSSRSPRIPATARNGTGSSPVMSGSTPKRV